MSTESETKTSGALSHIRVLDLSRVLAGPWCAQILADLGARVIKVERPERGDDTRGWGPPWFHGESAYFMSANRGKQSVAIDIASEAGQDLVRNLAKESDVVIENFKAGGLARYGLDYDAICKVRPDIIYCSITGFGHTGPLRHRPGYDFMIQAMGGLMSITGERDDLPGGGPQKVGVAVSDLMSGMYACTGILAALAHRSETGEGQHLDLALLDVQAAMLANQAMNYLVSGDAPGRAGNAHPNIVPYQVFATADGHIIVAVGNDDQFHRMCDVAECPELAGDSRFNTNSARVTHRDILVPLLAAVFIQRTSSDWLTALENALVPCGPINSIDEVFSNPQIVSREMLWRAVHGVGEEVNMVASPIKLSRTPAACAAAPPLLGQHTDVVLDQVLGLGKEKLDELREKGVIA